MSYTKLGIIGTAGRGSDKDLLTHAHYARMTSAVLKFISKQNINPQDLHLVSGGAAWSDHLVVTLANMHVVPFRNVTLYLPCELTEKGYVGQNDWSDRVANTANYYHRVFSEKVGIDSIAELNYLKDKSTLEVIKGGFKARNSLVAKFVSSEDGCLLAFTTGNDYSDQLPWTIRAFYPQDKAIHCGLKDGGTADTFDKSICSKFHARIGPISDDYKLSLI